MFIKRLWGEHTTLETRGEASANVDKQRRYHEILEVLGRKEMTAKEIANEMWRLGYIPTNERNFTSPRLTEMAQRGMVEVVGKKTCKFTGKTVSVWRAIFKELL